MANSPKIKLGYVDNIYSRMMHFENEGDIEQGHAHQFDHLTLLASGQIGDKITDYKAPYMIFIHKDVKHELTSLENNTVAYCIHVLRDVNTGNILDPKMVPNGVEILSSSMSFIK